MDNYELKFNKIVGSKVQFEIDDLDAFKKDLRKGHLKFNASPADHNMISNAQRKKIYALFRDISDYFFLIIRTHIDRCCSTYLFYF